MKRTACQRKRPWPNLNYYAVTYMEKLRKMRKPTKHSKQCSRYSGLNPVLAEYGEWMLTNLTSIRERDYILRPYKNSKKLIIFMSASCILLWCLYIQWNLSQTELGYNGYLSLAENLYSSEDLLPDQISSRCIKRNPPCNGKKNLSPLTFPYRQILLHK